MEDKKELQEEQTAKVTGGEGEPELTPAQIKKIFGGKGGGSGKQQTVGGDGIGALQ